MSYVQINLPKQPDYLLHILVLGGVEGVDFSGRGSQK